MNDVYSRADILEWAKDSHYKMVKENFGIKGFSPPGHDALQEWFDSRERIEEARTEYFKALETAKRIVARGRREKGLWR